MIDYLEGIGKITPVKDREDDENEILKECKRKFLNVPILNFFKDKADKFQQRREDYRNQNIKVESQPDFHEELSEDIVKISVDNSTLAVNIAMEAFAFEPKNFKYIESNNPKSRENCIYKYWMEGQDKFKKYIKEKIKKDSKKYIKRRKRNAKELDKHDEDDIIMGIEKESDDIVTMHDPNIGSSLFLNRTKNIQRRKRSMGQEGNSYSRS